MKRLITVIPLALLFAGPVSAMTMDMSFANLTYPDGPIAPASQSCTLPNTIAAPVCAPAR